MYAGCAARARAQADRRVDDTDWFCGIRNALGWNVRRDTVLGRPDRCVRKNGLFLHFLYKRGSCKILTFWPRQARNEQKETSKTRPFSLLSGASCYRRRSVASGSIPRLRHSTRSWKSSREEEARKAAGYRSQRKARSRLHGRLASGL